MNKKITRINRRMWVAGYRFIDTKNFKLIFFSFIIGHIVGFVGAAFRLALTYIETARNSFHLGAENSISVDWVLSIILCVIGVTVSLILVKKFAPEASGSGIQEIEGAMDGIRPIRWHRVIPIKFIASLFSLGSGLLLGREGPTIQIGGNIGKMVKDIFRQHDSVNNTLVSAGAAAGLASAFNAPLSGIVFVLEEMHEYFRFNFYSVAAIMIGAGTADIVARYLTDSNPIIQMRVFATPDLTYLWLFLVLGLLFGVLGFFYNKLLLFSLNFFRDRNHIPLVVIGVIVGIIIALIGIFFPDMIGGGYETIEKALDYSFTTSFLVILFVVRMFLSAFSYGTGAPGGIFLPMLSLGVIVGMIYGSIMQEMFPEVFSHPAIFAVAGMAGIFASIVRAPFTGVVLAIEMTSNFELVLPLIITTVSASVFTALLGNEPIYTTLLKRTLSAEAILPKNT